jgi:hypothetical protein
MLKFYCFDPDVAKNMPIILAKDYKFDWVEKAKTYYNETNDEVRTTKCPGIFSLLGKGWIHRTYQDITIKTNGDGETFEYKTNNQTLKRGGKYTNGYVGYHTKEQLQIFKNWKDDTLKTMLKIQSPWCVDVPKGYSLLMMPLPYSDDVRFTAATGLLRGKNFLNVQLYWHCKNSVEVIKAGTPINQMVLIKDEPSDYDISVIEDIDEFVKDIF